MADIPTYAASKIIVEGEFRAEYREGPCMVLRPDGGIEISRYEADAPVGENVLFNQQMIVRRQYLWSVPLRLQPDSK